MYRFLKCYLFVIPAIFSSFVFLSCTSQSSRYDDYALSGGRGDVPSSKDSWHSDPSSEVITGGGTPYPWETWVSGRDFDGYELSVPEIVRGDELARQGKTEDALKSYQAAMSKPLVQSERFSLISRIVSMQLRQEKFNEALTTLTQFFEAEKVSATNVPPRIALLFGYAYGMRADNDQAIAWLSQAGRAVGGNIRGGFLAETSSRGIRAILRNLNDENFDRTASVWKEDSFVSNIIAKERMYRATAGPDRKFGVIDYTHSRFWENAETLGQHQSTLNDTMLSNQLVVAFLPLSGPYASLGDQVKSGVELAFLGRPESGVRLEIVDTRGETYEAVSRFRELLASTKPDFILGPLLSEVAEALADEARRYDIPMIVFSKRDYFPIGNGIFRLGATVESQVHSLVNIGHGTLALQKHAIVYPRNALGESFAASYKAALLNRGGEVVFESAFDEGDSRVLIDIAQQIEAASVDAVFAPVNLETAGRLWTNLQPHVRRRLRLLGPASWYSPTALRNAKAALEGAVFVSPFFTESSKEIVKKFTEAFQNYYQSPPDFLAAQGFDAATLALTGLERAHQTSILLSELLPRISGYNGLTGMMQVQRTGEITRDFPVVEMRSGKLQEIDATETVPSFAARGNEVMQRPSQGARWLGAEQEGGM